VRGVVIDPDDRTLLVLFDFQDRLAFDGQRERCISSVGSDSSPPHDRARNADEPIDAGP
jgi:hypothetical protein